MLEACFNSDRIGRMMRDTFEQKADDMWRLIVAPRLMNGMLAKTPWLENHVSKFSERRDILFGNFRSMEIAQFSGRNYVGFGEVLVPRQGPFTTSNKVKKHTNPEANRSGLARRRRL